MGNQVRESHPYQAHHRGAGRADNRQIVLVMVEILPGGLRHQFRRRADLKHIVKAHQKQCVQYDIHIVQIVELAIQGRRRQRHRIAVLLHYIHLVKGGMLGMVGAYPDALPAVNTEFGINLCLSVPDPDRLGRAALDAVDASLAQFRIQTHRMVKFIHILLPPVLFPKCCQYSIQTEIRVVNCMICTSARQIPTAMRWHRLEILTTQWHKSVGSKL